MPQQNGVAERMDRTLLRVRCMLASSGLSKRFWCEAVCNASYLINRSPYVPLNGKCPESVRSRTQINFANLKVFGCSAIVHHKNDKLNLSQLNVFFLVILMG